MKSVLLLTLFTLTYCGLAFSETDSVVEPENASAVLEDMFAETKARLDLTDEQVEQVTPILQSSFESRRAILLEYGIDIESRKPPAQKLGFRKALSEYVAMQNERKNRMRERLRASR
jgi:hypothetical protein